MNTAQIEKIAREVNISVRKMRAVVAVMRREKLLPPGDKLADVTKMKAYLNQGISLSVPQFVELIENPALIKAMGAKGATARQMIADLDNPTEGDLPKYLPVWVQGACAGNAFETECLVNWVKATQPDRTVGYHYFAVRIALACNEEWRDKTIKRLHRAFLAVQKHPSFAGWSSVVEGRNRRRTLYHRPK